MKATVYLGNLQIHLEVADSEHAYQELTRQSWQITRLNLAATAEGWNPADCIPFCETGSDANEYCGFVNMKTGERIRFGQQKPGKGGHWYQRSKEDKHYRGPEKFGGESFAGARLPAPDDAPQARQLPQVSGRPSARPNARPQEAPKDEPQEERGPAATPKQITAIRKLCARIAGGIELDTYEIDLELNRNGIRPIDTLTEEEAGRAIIELSKTGREVAQ